MRGVSHVKRKKVFEILPKIFRILEASKN